MDIMSIMPLKWIREKLLKDNHHDGLQKVIPDFSKLARWWRSDLNLILKFNLELELNCPALDA